jgi:hypothetical protein
MPLDVYIHVSSSDQMPRYTKDKMALVINFDSSALDGTHWCGIALHDNVAYIIDSLRISPLPALIAYWIRKYATTSFINRNMIQDPHGAFCGLHTIYFLESFFIHNKSFSEIIAAYNNDNMVANDLAVLDYFTDTINNAT